MPLDSLGSPPPFPLLLPSLHSPTRQVCIKALGEMIDPLSPATRKDLVKTETAIQAYCDKAPGEKETKLCYYIDPIKREISQPVKNGVPYPVICQRLKKKSAEICALKYASNAAVAITRTTDLTKLRTKDLKAFTMEKNIPCGECIEKADFEKAITKYFEAHPEL